MSALVERLLMLSRADTGQAKLSTERIELGELADDVAAQLDVLADEKQQSVVVEVDQRVRWSGDRLVLRQALLNLVDNAIKYTPKGGRITVRVDCSLGVAVLEVTDTGPGIPPNLRERVFDRFYRVDGSRARGSAGGMGLGLSIARWAVEVHGGRLTLEQADDAGSTIPDHAAGGFPRGCQTIAACGFLSGPSNDGRGPKVDDPDPPLSGYSLQSSVRRVVRIGNRDHVLARHAQPDSRNPLGTSASAGLFPHSVKSR